MAIMVREEALVAMLGGSPLAGRLSGQAELASLL
jgi:hypothetical protein